MRRCEQCGLEIIDRFYLSSLDRVWHQDCLLCSCCRVRLAQAGNTLYVKNAKREDAGVYICQGINSRGNVIFEYRAVVTISGT